MPNTDTADEDFQMVETADAKVASVNTTVLTAVRDAAIEGSKAVYSYGFALFSSLNAVVYGVQAAIASVQAMGNLVKLAFYDTTRVAANTLYYQDEKATEVAKKDADESLAAGCKAMEVACQQTIAMFSDAYDATLQTVEGLGHTQNALCFAWDAASRVRDAAYDLLAAPAEDHELAFKNKEMDPLFVS